MDFAVRVTRRLVLCKSAGLLVGQLLIGLFVELLCLDLGDLLCVRKMSLQSIVVKGYLLARAWQVLLTAAVMRF